MSIAANLPAPQPTYSLAELTEMFKRLNQRTKNRIRRAFNDKYQYSEQDTTFQRLMDGRLMLCYDEYQFLCAEITTHYNFYNWAKTQR